ncbi:MAG: radical SAM protein, partial [Clostridiales bacterium]|nr:radical SAM protein [Clostridiales bacterium]
MAMKGVVFSLGCKVNTYEGQSIMRTLAEAGAIVSDKLETADFYIINTCSVTAEADRKSRQAVARVLKLNPNALVYICGCGSQNDPDAFLQKDNVRFVSGVGGKGKIAEAVLADLKKEAHAAENRTCDLPKTYEDELFPHSTRTRSYIKVQDGCNNFCSYCIIPYLRGRSRSRSMLSIVEEATVAAAHSKELVLTGVDISAYGKDIGTDLTALVRALGPLSVRKRLGSLECTVVTDELLHAMRESGFCDHFHLSLQSGSSSVLKRMNRKYTVERYLRAVQD